VKRLVNKVAIASTLDLIPDVTFLLNLPVRAGLSRLQIRGEITKMDEEPVEFHELIRQGYMLIAKREPNRIKKINADREILEIHEDIKNLILESISS